MGTTSKVNIGGIILAGGKGTRMRRIKPLVKLGGVTLLERVVRTLESTLNEIVIVTSDSIFKSLKIENRVKVVTDHFPSKGPLSALYTGLEFATSQFNFVVACDMPFLNPEIVKALAKSITGFDAVVPSIYGEIQPLHAVYSRTCRDVALPLALSGKGIRHMLRALKTKYVFQDEIEILDPTLLSFFSVDSPLDLKTAEKHLNDTRLSL